jgi:hypothetical protein
MQRGALIYFGPKDKPAIVAALHRNTAGVLYEQDAPVPIIDGRDPVVVAVALRSAIERFSIRDRNLRDAKKTEWPTYRAAGVRSVREFEKTYLCINVHALNEAELFYDAYAQPRGEEDITLHVTLSRHGQDSEFGRKVLRLLDACIDWQRKADLSPA